MTKPLSVTVVVEPMPPTAKYAFTARLLSPRGTRLGVSQGLSWRKAAQLSLKLADKHGFQVLNRSEIEAKIAVSPAPQTVTQDVQPTTGQLEALRRFAAENGRLWKPRLISVWANGQYVCSPEDAQLLQSVRNTFGSSWLYRMQLVTEHFWGIEPATARPAVWGARALYKDYRYELLHNRVSRRGDTGELCRWLDGSALPWLVKELRMRRLPGNSPEIMKYSDGDYTLHASPKMSFGYLYLGAWSK